MDPAPSRMPVRHIARVLFRHRRKIGVFALAVLVAVALFTLLSPRAYRSQGKLLVRLGRENATLDPTATFGQSPVVAVPQSRENEINTAAEILKSRVLLEKVVDAVGPEAILSGRSPAPDSAAAPADEARRHKAVLKLAKQLDVEPVKKTNVLAVSYDGPTPELAQTVVAKLLDFYLDRHMQLHRTPAAHQFLSEQTARQKAQLTRAEEELRELKNATGLVTADGQRQLAAARIARLEDELLQAGSALAAAEAEVRLLHEKLAKLAPTHVTARTRGGPNEASNAMRGQLYTLQVRALELAQRLPEGNPDLERARKQAESARDVLRQEERDREQITEGPNRVYEETQLALLRQEPVVTALKAKADALRGQLDRQREELKALNENSLRVARLEREISMQDSHYRRYAENLEQAQIDRALEAERISNISIVQPATLDADAVRPRLLVNFGVGLLLAVLGGAALALLAERLDPSVRTPEDVETWLGLPVLAAVPHLNGHAATPDRIEALP